MLASTFFVAILDNWIHQFCEFIFKRTKPQMTTDSEEQLVNPSLASSSLESQEVRNRKNKPIIGKITKIIIGLLLHSILTGMSIGMRDSEDEIMAGLLAIIPHKLTVLIVLSTMTLEINRISRFIHILLFSIAMPIGFLLSIGSFQKSLQSTAVRSVRYGGCLEIARKIIEGGRLRLKVLPVMICNIINAAEGPIFET